MEDITAKDGTLSEAIDSFLRDLVEIGWTPERLIKRFTELRYEYLRLTDACFIAKVDDQSTISKAPHLPNDTMA